MPDKRRLHSIQVIDSHTAGEPTRLVVSGGPDLGTGPLATRLERFRSQHDAFRSAIVNEPRGSDVLVGALLCEPFDSTCDIGVIFFNNVGYLGMCGHGSIGVVTSLAHLGKITPDLVRIETPVGVVGATLHPSGQVRIENVASHRAQFAVDVWNSERFVATSRGSGSISRHRCAAAQICRCWLTLRALEGAGS